MKKLRILEASEVGHGILIETDAGWVSPKDIRNSEMLKEAANLDYRNPFEFYAVLQKYDTPNRNGRFYPERILKREGGFVIDHAGPTNFGITIPPYKEFTRKDVNEDTIRNMTKEDAISFYKWLLKKERGYSSLYIGS
jgi:hypothetical protein